MGMPYLRSMPAILEAHYQLAKWRAENSKVLPESAEYKHHEAMDIKKDDFWERNEREAYESDKL